MGKWLAVNGEAIYGTSPTLFGAEAGAFSATDKDSKGKARWVPAWQWRSTTRPDKIYLEIFAWPAAGVFHLDKLPRKVTGAYLLADAKHAPLKLTHTGDALDIALPAQAPDPIASVIVLENTEIALGWAIIGSPKGPITNVTEITARFRATGHSVFRCSLGRANADGLNEARRGGFCGLSSLPEPPQAAYLAVRFTELLQRAVNARRSRANAVRCTVAVCCKRCT